MSVSRQSILTVFVCMVPYHSRSRSFIWYLFPLSSTIPYPYYRSQFILIMKTNSHGDNSGIGRRRGASAATKTVTTSILVAVVCFIIVSALLIILSREVPSVKHNVVATKIEKEAGVGSIRKSQKKHDGMLGEIMRADVHLVEIDVSNMISTKDGYAEVKAIFCKLDWDAYKNNPPSFPMFRFLVSHSFCDKRKNQLIVDLATIAEKTRRSDAQSMDPTGFVFHESRVGSTLVANSLQSMNPAMNRVYSESDPINTALKTDNPQLFRDVVYLMGLTNSPDEVNLFFKVSSIGSKKINVMREAFPTVPWIFVYREPVQTMMSHLDPAKVQAKKSGRIKAVCTRARSYPPKDLRDLVAQEGIYDMDKLSDQEFCAAHLASLCESALRELKESNKGRAVEYDGLIDKLLRCGAIVRAIVIANFEM